MKIGILSRNPTLYSTRRLVEAARARGHQALVIDTTSVAVEVGVANGQNPGVKTIVPRSLTRGLIRRAVRLPEVDAIIPRIGASITFYGLAVVRQFEAQNVVSTASSEAIAHSRDKLHSLQIMSQVGLPIPKTAVIARPDGLFSAIRAVGGPPVIIKITRGTQGQGVIKAINMATAEAVLNVLRKKQRQALVQEYIAEARGRDIRLIVVGDRCVASMKRIASDGDFRSNLHRGGTAVPYSPDPATEKLALAAAEAHGLRIGGVDIIQSERGPLLLEVNSSPGLEGIEQATQVDIASHIIQYLEREVAKQKRLPNRRKRR